MDILQYIAAVNYDPQQVKASFSMEEINKKDKTGKTPLICAVIKGDIKAVQLLVHLDADVELADNEGRKATYYAAVFGYPKILAILLKSGCGG